jgi:sugar-specific transcriptional regulator TrmB
MHPLDYLQQNFRLSDNEVKLLRLLKEGAFSVSKLSAASGVPMGRIYRILNDLEAKKLVTYDNHPRMYTAQPWSDRVIEFLNQQNEELQRHKKAVLDSLERHYTPTVELITSMAQFKSQFFSWVSGSKFLYYVDVGLAFPLIFLSPSETESLKIIRAVNPNYQYTEEKRRNRETFWNNLQSFPNIRHLVEEKTLHFFLSIVDEKFGREYLEKRVGETKKMMKTYGHKIRVISGLFTNRVIITDSHFISCTYLNNRVLVLKVDSPSIIKMHKEWYEDSFNEAARYGLAVDQWMQNNPSKEQKITVKTGE